MNLLNKINNLYIIILCLFIFVQCDISKPVIVNGHECDIEKIAYENDSDIIRYCALAKGTVANGIYLPAGTWVGFNKEGDHLYWCISPIDINVNGIPCKAERYINFHDNGKLSDCFLSEDAIIQGIPCKNGNDQSTCYAGNNQYNCSHYVYFTPDGKLSHCVLAEALNIQGVPCQESCDINICSTGSVLSCTLSADIAVNGIVCNLGMYIVYDYDNCSEFKECRYRKF